MSFRLLPPCVHCSNDSFDENICSECLFFVRSMVDEKFVTPLHFDPSDHDFCGHCFKLVPCLLCKEYYNGVES